MVAIRLQRVGRKNHPEFRVVVIEHARAAKSRRVIENVGHYNPHTKAVSLKSERITYWMSRGAKPSDVLYNMLITQGIIEGKKRNVLPRKRPVGVAAAPVASSTSSAQPDVDEGSSQGEESVSENAAATT